VNRVLSLPHTTIVPGLLDALKSTRSRTRVTPKGMIRFELTSGPVEMKIAAGQQPIEPGTEVYVWWKGGGFVCAPTVDVDAEERRSRKIEKRVMQARETLAAARADRWARASAYADLPAERPQEEAPVSQPMSIY
jgi:hypothetical protein